MKHERIKKIEHYLMEHESISLDDLCSMFGVSKNTIRRDIAELHSRGVVKKVYGGVTLNTDEHRSRYHRGQLQKINGSTIIGELASSLVKSGDVIFIDSGLTPIQLIPYLKNLEKITIITTCLNVIIEAANYSNINVISTGGILQNETNSFAGISTLNFLKDLNISKSFMSTAAVSIEKGITNNNYLDTEIKKAIISISDQIILLADHSKLDQTSMMKYCSLEDIDYFVTDKEPDSKYVDFFKLNDIGLIYSES